MWLKLLMGEAPNRIVGDWMSNDNMVVINFKKRMMMFENYDIWVIAPMDPNEGWRYIEPVKDEVFRGWDHAHNIYEDYI